VAHPVASTSAIDGIARSALRDQLQRCVIAMRCRTSSSCRAPNRLQELQKASAVPSRHAPTTQQSDPRGQRRRGVEELGDDAFGKLRNRARAKDYIGAGKVFCLAARNAGRSRTIRRGILSPLHVSTLAHRLLTSNTSRTSAQRTRRRQQNAETSASHSCCAVASTLRPCRRSTPTGPACRKRVCGRPSCRPAGR